MILSAEERKQLKLTGVLSANDGERFAIRVITRNGVMTAEQMAVVGEVAKKYGNGEFCFTTRLTVEIMYVPYANIRPALEMLSAGGLTTGGTGAKVRPLVCCKGTYCVFGLCDTQGITEKLHKKFYDGYRDAALPHKFKIAVGGCPNNCVKPDLNDVGIVGQRKPVFNAELCRGCKKCVINTICPAAAAVVESGKLQIDEEVCRRCGKCYNKCPFKSITKSEDGFKIYLGGRWGRVSRPGTLLSGLFTEAQAIDMVEKALLLFKAFAKAGERFGAMIDRVGVDTVKELVADDSLLKRKADILALPVGTVEC